MKMNWAEKLVLNNPLRAFFQRKIEAGIFRQLTRPINGALALEIGCGQGAGAMLLLEDFGVRRVDACDYDPGQVAVARKHVGSLCDGRLHLFIADAGCLPVRSCSYDVVLDSAVLHHLPDWRAGVREVCRVLKPGGQFLFFEVLKHALDRWLYRTFFEHPQEDRFSAEAFLCVLEDAGLKVGENFTLRFRGDFLYGAAIKE